MTPTLESRFAGSLIGQCLGDALGVVVEGYPAASCRDYVDRFLRAGRAGERGCEPFAFGQYTDDSQLARELMQSYVARGGFEPADYAGRVAAIFTEKRIVGRICHEFVCVDEETSGQISVIRLRPRVAGDIARPSSGW